jgi:hypothetical protein
MVVELNDREIKAIQAWAESIIHGGHWGDGDAIVPEEDIILQKLNAAAGSKLTLNEHEVRIILSWSDSTLGILNLEEESVIRKLTALLES